MILCSDSQKNVLLTVKKMSLARIEDVGRDDFLKVNRTACYHVALLTPAALKILGLKASAKARAFSQGPHSMPEALTANLRRSPAAPWRWSEMMRGGWLGEAPGRQNARMSSPFIVKICNHISVESLIDRLPGAIRAKGQTTLST